MSDIATVDPLDTKTGKTWGSKGAAGDALSRVPNEAPFIAIWIETDANGESSVKWSKANLTYHGYSTMAIALLEFAQACVRKDIDR